MTHRLSIRRMTMSIGVVVVALLAGTAHAGNYQDHVLPSTTRHTVEHNNTQPVADTSAHRTMGDRVPVGNYQMHAPLDTTRRDHPTPGAMTADSRDVAMMPSTHARQ